jgi:hypothetical protein
MLGGRMRMAAAGVVAGGDWWEAGGVAALAAYQPKGAASLAASYVNLANPGTNDAAPGTAPTLVANGWSFASASSQYLTTGIAPGADYTAAIRIVSWTFTVSAILVGSIVPTNAFYINQSAADERRYRYGTTARAVSSVSNAPGVRIIAGVNGYWYDGSLTTDTTALGNNGNAAGLYIGAQNNGGVAQNHATAVVAAFAIYSSVLNSTQVTALAAAMAAL